MESSLPLWRVVRPVLLAAAAATSWLAISATAATADSSTDGEPLTSQVLSTVRPVIAQDTAVAERPSAPLPGGRTPDSGLSSVLPALQPLAGAVTGRADALVAKVPVDGGPVPGSVLTLPPLTPVTDPVVGLADDVVSTVAATADSAVASVVDGVGRVLDAVTGPVDGVVPLPALPSVPVEPPAGTIGAAGPDALPAEPAPDGSPAIAAEATAAPVSTPDGRGAVSPADSAAHFRTDPAGLPPTADSVMVPLPDVPADELAPIVPDTPPAIPGSGSGAGASSGGAAHPAWLSTFRLHLAGTLSILACGDLLAPPSPVSFDPGSSPD